MTQTAGDIHADEPRCYDGIVCFGGEDWWYHNRGHYDMRMMQAFARDVPVLFVNSIGMRTPSVREGRMFLTRMRRKIRSLRQGLVHISPGFGVVSPICMPGPAGVRLTRPLTTMRVRRAMRSLGMSRPLAWVTCPTALPLVDGLRPSGLVYQRTDRYEQFRDVDVEAIRALDRDLKTQADLVLYCADSLHQDERSPSMTSVLIEHGVDASVFATAAREFDQDPTASEPASMRDIPHPRVGFIGAIDGHTFDPDLFVDVAGRCPNASFVLIGGCTLPGDWARLPNVYRIPQQPVERVASFMAACDTLIMPWVRSEWIKGCHPIKLKEYLATGRPVVTTDFPELRRYEGLVRIANDANGFARHINAALDAAANGTHDPQPGRIRASGTWQDQADAASRELERVGLHPVFRRPAKAAAYIEPHGIPAPVAAENTPSAIARSTDPSDATDTNDTAIDFTTHTARPDTTPRVTQAVILAGGLRPHPIVDHLGRSVLDLHLAADVTVLDHWIDALRGETELPIRVVHNGAVPAPWPNDETHELIFEQDPHPFRGPAGVLRDVCTHGPSGDRTQSGRDAHILVVEAARMLDGDLSTMLTRHIDYDAAITIARNPDGSPGGIYVVRCDTLDLIPRLGFIDMKEQWIPAIKEAGHRVHVVDLPGHGSMPLWTRGQVVAAARVRAMRERARRAFAFPTGRHQSRPLKVVSPGALVGPDATVIDSIIMPGTFVGSKATVIRSVVGPDSYIASGHEVIDAVVHGTTVRGERDTRSAS